MHPIVLYWTARGQTNIVILKRNESQGPHTFSKNRSIICQVETTSVLVDFFVGRLLARLYMPEKAHVCISDSREKSLSASLSSSWVEPNNCACGIAVVVQYSNASRGLADTASSESGGNDFGTDSRSIICGSLLCHHPSSILPEEANPNHPPKSIPRQAFQYTS